MEERLRIEGEFWIRNAASVRSRLLERSKDAFVLDLGGVTEFDTAGVQILLSLKKEREAKGQTLRLSAMSEPVERLLAFYNLRDTFDTGTGSVSQHEVSGGEDG
jgi:anti-anti-sigma factor